MKWNHTCNRFVAFFDIMGFKDLVLHNTHDSVLRKMNKIKTIISPLEKDLTQFLNQEENELTADQKSKIIQTAVKPVFFSDSILVTTTSDTEADLREIIFVSIWLTKRSFEIGLPIKGGVSYGKFTADFEKSIYFGQPLIDAYLLQEDLQLYGTIYDHNFENYLIKKRLQDEVKGLAHYKTPLKSGKITHLLTDWVYYHQQHISDIKTVKKLYRTVSGRPRIYVDNTLDYLNFLIAKRKNGK